MSSEDIAKGSMQLTRLTPEDGDVLERYGHLYDDLLHSIHLDFSDRTQRIGWAEVIFLARKEGGDPRGVHVRLRFLDVRAFQFTEGNSSYLVVDDGARITWKEGLVTLDLDPGPNGIDEPIPDRVSKFFITAKACEWAEEPIPE
ncbi:hypothetical protein [Corallococcus terminator]|uniref:Uncharacterized protein n=1 Tax=Corallococcus terminator TaxID=2316733 RepID=A0A3A8IBW8_9BACT|nr:hypothetical protein [Corallococcus terminator]RKG77324.1 hypothetical protein D7V88_31175 [Corallococcus terminator]